MARAGKTWLWQMPPGVADPLFECELAEQLHMTVGELHHGRGTPMSLHEFTVVWPLYWAYKDRRAKQEAERQQRTFQ